MDKYNNEDLSLMTLPKWQLLTVSFYPNKELNKVFEIAQLILTKDIDIAALVEVGGKESLDNFNRYFLNNDYQVFHTPSNSDRGIDTGFLVKKTLAPYCRIKDYTKDNIGSGKKFSRGLQQLKLRHQKHNYYFLLVHLKSKLNKSGKDFEGREQRSKEVKHLLKKARQIKSQDSVIMLGDFNGIIASRPETEAELLPIISQGDFLDALELIGATQRTSYIYFKANGDSTKMQLDYAFLNQSAQTKLKTAYMCDFNGFKDPCYPTDKKEKGRLASDHFPYYFELD